MSGGETQDDEVAKPGRQVPGESHERCGWPHMGSLDVAYHDTRWCKPLHDERELFAMLCLEGMQAGLSWSLILRREGEIRAAFDDFDPRVVASYDDERVESLMRDDRVIRNRRKIAAAVANARAFLQTEDDEGSFDRYIWGFSDGRVVMHHPVTLADVPCESDLSREVSRDLRRRGFSFVGPVIVYSYLQAIGVINDHLETCPWK